MTKSSRDKEKHGKSSDISLDHCEEGTAARTRPFSYDEIMSKRRNKKKSKDDEKVEAVENKAGDGDVENFADHYGYERSNAHNKDSFDVKKHSSEEHAKLSSRMKEESTYMKDEYLSKGKEREVRNSGKKLKEKENKDIRTKATVRIDEKIRGKRKGDEQRTNDSKHEAEKRRSRDSEKDRYIEGRRGKSEIENKSKHQNEVDEKDRGKNSTRIQDIRKKQDLAASHTKERKELSKSHHEELKLKRRRSRSREHDDRNRRSISLSPKAHKRTSYHGKQQEDLSSHSLKGRSGRKHSDIERSKLTNNGSSNHYKRHGGSMSERLGGYSPRKRRTDAAVKTPSPIKRSPEKKIAKWDVAPTGGASSAPVHSNFQLPNQNALPKILKAATVVPVTSTTVKPLSGVSPGTSITNKNNSLDSIQLTEATRPARRLYVENLPSSASEKAVMECLNNFLISSGVNHIQGKQPCISCIMHKEKGQALLEFLTPEDASAALSFDGSSFSGSIIKIRRPKDFVELATVEPEKSAAAVDAISGIVEDSPHKIFIGGISKALSSKMLLEIVGAFGRLKAYQFERSNNRPFAFVEYADQSATVKACAGLNGMKLGGQVITAVKAFPNALPLESSGYSPFSGIPEHAKPLLEKPTQVLKLENVIVREALSLLSHSEIEEVLEDVRLECTRFGNVKSINIVKHGAYTPNSKPEASEVVNDVVSAGPQQNLECDETYAKAETLKEVRDDEIAEGDNIHNDKLAVNLMDDELSQQGQLGRDMVVKDLACSNLSELPPQGNSSKDESDCKNDELTDNIQTKGIGDGNKSMAREELDLEEGSGKVKEPFMDNRGLLDTEKEDVNEQGCSLERIFEPGCVFVEFGRIEASCTAAHCLHGRFYDDRIVRVGYVPLYIYKARFPK